jgi:spermidine synthase
VRSAWFFLFFAVSGFCSLIYEVAWLRLAMAAFGVTTPMVSLVLSLFMAGLGLGSVLAGRLSTRPSLASPARALQLYALAEGTIGLSSILVPWGFLVGSGLLARLGTSWGSLTHYLLAGLVLLIGMLPFGICMGATLPLAMTAMRRLQGDRRSFSYLYLANLIGATLGTLGAAFVLIELFGFHGTLRVAGVLNALLAATAYGLSGRLTQSNTAHTDAPAPAPSDTAWRPIGFWWLFLTGMCSMAMEVVWTRLYTTYLTTVVYAFAGILAIYLASTYVGSQLYRAYARWRGTDGALWLYVAAAVGLLALLPLYAADPSAQRPGFLGGLRMVAHGIAPFCASLGFLTPLLVDRYARGSAERAGFAYAVNVVGCIVGPLLAGFLLLPFYSERLSLLLLALPLFLTALYTIATSAAGRARAPALALCLLSAVPAVRALTITRTAIEAVPPPKVERRDYTATTVASGIGMERKLEVNGVGMTSLTPITKMMVHLPLALLPSSPKKVLVICFGMGTSYRSALSWGIQTTAVELVPSVPELIGFFHPDGAQLLHHPLGRVVVDDGRRFLSREADLYDVVVMDPPPPVEAAGSSLLYSKEMYQAVRRRLAPGGIMQQWFPTGYKNDDAATLAAVVRAVLESFPHVYGFRSVEGTGYHLFASEQPIALPSPAELVQRIPADARRDLVEWGGSAEAMVARVLAQPVALAAISAAPVPTLSDDRPVNEYYLLRRRHFDSFGSF